MKRGSIAFVVLLSLSLLVICLIALSWIFFPVTRSWITFDSKNGNELISFVIAVLQLGGFAVIATITLLYISFWRPAKFIFTGFDNSSIVSNIEQRPIDINALAREELVNQFKYLYESLHKYMDAEKGDTDDIGDIDAATLIEESPFTHQHIKLESEHLLNLAQNLSIAGAKNMKEELKALIKVFQDGEKYDDLLRMIGESVPQEISPIMKIIDAIIPPRLVEARGHLQWRSKTLEPNHVGITIEFSGSFTASDEITNRTIWWQHPNNPGAPKSRSRRAKNEHLLVEFRETNILEVTDCYIELLAPAMSWLALTFLEHHALQHKPFMHSRKLYKSQLHYLLGSLYYAYSQKYNAYRDFFWRLAIEHLDQTTKLDPEWCIPYLFVANIYGSTVKKMPEGNRKEQFLKNALLRYSKTIQHTEDIEKKLKSQYGVAKKIKEVSLVHKKLLVRQTLVELDNFGDIINIIQEKIQTSTLNAKQLDIKDYDSFIKNTIDIMYKDFLDAKIVKILQAPDFVSFIQPRLQNTVSHSDLKQKTGKEAQNLMANDEVIRTILGGAFQKKLEGLNDSDFDLSLQADGSYLFNLALLDMISCQKFIGFHSAAKHSQLLLMCSLARSPELWTFAQQQEAFTKKIPSLGELRNTLEDIRKKNPHLSELEGFTLVNTIKDIIPETEYESIKKPDTQTLKIMNASIGM